MKTKQNKKGDIKALAEGFFENAPTFKEWKDEKSLKELMSKVTKK